MIVVFLLFLGWCVLGAHLWREAHTLKGEHDAFETRMAREREKRAILIDKLREDLKASEHTLKLLQIHRSIHMWYSGLDGRTEIG